MSFICLSGNDFIAINKINLYFLKSVICHFKIKHKDVFKSVFLKVNTVLKFNFKF